MFTLDEVGDRIGLVRWPVWVVIESVIPIVDSNVPVIRIGETRTVSSKEVLEGSVGYRAVWVEFDDAEIQVKCDIFRTAKWIGRKYIGMDDNSVPRCVIEWVILNGGISSSTGAVRGTKIGLRII